MKAKALNKVTIIVPTYNRHKFLSKLLQFYESYSFPSPILILDSSNTDINKNELTDFFHHQQVTYKKFNSSTLPITKICNGMQFVNTEYSVICADDDFIIPQSLERCVEFLENNTEYAIAQGLYIQSTIDESGTFLWNPLYREQNSIENDKPIARFKHYLNDFKGTFFYAVRRTNLLNLVMEETSINTSDWGLSEILPSALSITYGKLKVLPILYSSRTNSDISGGGVNNSGPKNWYSPEKLEKAARCTAKHLHQYEGLDYESALHEVDITFKIMAETSINRWTVKNRTKKRTLNTLKSLIKKSFFGKYVFKIKHKLFTIIGTKNKDSITNQYSNLFEKKESDCYSDYNKIRTLMLK